MSTEKRAFVSYLALGQGEEWFDFRTKALFLERLDNLMDQKLDFLCMPCFIQDEDTDRFVTETAKISRRVNKYMLCQNQLTPLPGEDLQYAVEKSQSSSSDFVTRQQNKFILSTNSPCQHLRNCNNNNNLIIYRLLLCNYQYKNFQSHITIKC